MSVLDPWMLPHVYCGSPQSHRPHAHVRNNLDEWCEGMTPDHPAEDARDERLDANRTGGHDREALLSQGLSEGEVDDLLCDLLVETRGKDGDKVRRQIERLAARLTKEIAAAEQRGAAEVKARVEAVIAQWPVGDNGQDYRAAVTQCAAAIRRALGGTAGD